MLGVQVTIDGDQVVLQGLSGLAHDLSPAIDRGLVRIAKGVHRESYYWLSGPGRKIMRTTDRRQHGGRNKTARRGQASSLQAKPGSYPVPVLTGTLRRLLDWLRPGAAKDGFQAGANEVIVYDSAEYAGVIYDSRGSSAGYGPRKYLEDGFSRFNQGSEVSKILDEEIGMEINRRGF